MPDGGNILTAPPVTSSGQLSTRIGALDGLRALVIVVLLAHFTINVARHTDGWLAAPIYALAPIGVVGLDVFFVLSGFLITGILLDTKGAPDFFRNFYLRRAARILPLYYGFLLVYLVLLPAIVSWDASSISLTPVQQLPYWFHFVNITDGLGGRLAAYTDHLWSLSIEEQFYLLWPLVVWLCSTRGLRRVAIACLVLAPIVRTVLSYALPDRLFFYTFTFGRLDGLALGALLAIAWREPSGIGALARTIRRVGLASLVVLLPVAVWIVRVLSDGAYVPGWQGPFFLACSAWCGGAIVATVLEGRGGWLLRTAESRVARRIGLYSYAMYVIHDPLAHVLDQAGWIHRPGGEATLLSLTGYVVVMSALTFGLAALSWHLLEKPILRLRPPMAMPPAATEPPAARR